MAAAEAAAAAEAQAASPWGADDESRRFYTDIPDLHDRVPGVLLEGSGAADKDGEPAAKDGPPAVAAAAAPATAEKDKDKGRGGGDAVETHLHKICTLSSAAALDQWCVDFCFLGFSKGNRRRFVRFAGTGPTNRKLLESENIAYVARAAAELAGAFKDIGEPLAALVEEDLAVLHARKGTQEHHLLPRLRNAKLLGELVKFGLATPAAVFQALRILLEDFVGHAVDVSCALLESCGRYLYRTPDTHVRTGNAVDVLWKLASSKTLSERQMALVENAVYGTKASDDAAAGAIRIVPNTAKRRKPKPELLLFVRWLLDVQLGRPKGFNFVIKKLRKFPWTDEPWAPEGADAVPTHGLSAKAMVVASVLRCVHKGVGGSSEQIRQVAELVKRFSQHRKDFRVLVVDDLIEATIMGLEINALYPKHQKRLAHVRLIGELFNARQVEFSVLVYVLKLLLNPPESATAAEAVDDCFRIRLICALLAGTYQNALKVRNGKAFLNEYLRFFQRFVLWKAESMAAARLAEQGTLSGNAQAQLAAITEDDEDEREDMVDEKDGKDGTDGKGEKATDSRTEARAPLPMDIEFELEDLFDRVRLKDFVRVTSFADAQKAVESYLLESGEPVPEADGDEEMVDEDEPPMDDEDDDDGDDEENEVPEGNEADGLEDEEDSDDDDDDDDEEDDEEEDEEDEEEDDDDDMEDDDEELDEETREARAAEDAFARDFAALVSSSSSAGARRGAFEVAQPMHFDGPTTEAPEAAASSGAAMVAFKVLGGGISAKKQREINIPANSTLARRRLDAAEADDAERRALKAAILRGVEEDHIAEAEAARDARKAKLRWMG